jgi:hypothetical protein
VFNNRQFLLAAHHTLSWQSVGKDDAANARLPNSWIFQGKSSGFLHISEQKGNCIRGEICHTTSPVNSKYVQASKTTVLQSYVFFNIWFSASYLKGCPKRICLDSKVNS